MRSQCMAAAVFAVLATGSSAVVTAQEAAEAGSSPSGQLQEVIVTAERRTTDVQRSANSISVLGGAEMLAEGRTSLAQILEDVPGIQGGAATGLGAAGTDTTASGLIIRGIPSNGGGANIAPAAAVYVDGVYEGLGGGYDIDRVEVLRGPQGTLYGRSATSGVVATYTAKPLLDRVGGNAAVEFGNYSLKHYTGAVSVPLVGDVLAVRIAANRYERDGYFSAEGGAIRTTDAKIKLLYQPTADLSVLLGAAMQDNSPRFGGTTISLLSVTAPNTYVYTDSPIGSGENKHRQYWAEVNWHLNYGTLTWLPAYRTFRTDSTTFIRSGLGLDTVSRTPWDHFHTQELRLASNTDQAFTWLVGAFYYNNGLSSRSTTTIVSPPPLAGRIAMDPYIKDRSTRDVGAFVQSTYDLTDSWRLTAGLRYDDTQVTMAEDYASSSLITGALTGGSLPNATETGIRKFKNTTFKARVEHDLTPQNLLYASVSSGFSPGDISIAQDSNNQPFVLELRAETLISYELGTKNRFLDNTLQLNAALYFNDYGAYQSAGTNLTPTALTPTLGTIASPAQVLGGELETIYQLTPADRVNLNLAYTDARFVDKTGTVINIGTTQRTFADFYARDEIPSVVPFSANLSYEHVFTLPGNSTLRVRAAARYLAGHDQANLTPQQLATSAPFVRVDSQVVGDANISWVSANGNWSVTGYVRNVDDNEYKNQVQLQNPLWTATPYDPRTWGVVLSTRF